MQPEKLESLASLRPNFLPRARQGEMAPMPRKKRKRRLTPAVSVASLRDRMERAYLEWKKCAGQHSWLIGRDLAFAGAMHDPFENSPSNVKIRREVNAAFDEFDRAIVKLVERDKTAIGDPRILERISQAQSLDDKNFFKYLGLGLGSNVGIDKRYSKRDEVATLFKCAVAYLEGNENLIKEEYEHWKNFNIEKRRLEKPIDLEEYCSTKDADFKAVVALWEKAKKSMTGESYNNVKGDFATFHQRVIGLAEQLRRGSIPLPTLSLK